MPIKVNNPSTLNVVSLNCCSIRSQAKQGLLHALIEEHIEQKLL